METETLPKLRKPIIDKVNDVLATTDYGLFKNVGGNRHINPLHLTRLMASMEEEYLTIPIIVNENHEIIDGQHRAACCQQLQLPIYFIICPGYGLKEVNIANSNIEEWRPMDFAMSFAERGYRHYVEYMKFERRYKLSHLVNLSLLSGNLKLNDKGKSHEFKMGRFEIKDINLAHSLAKMVFDFEHLYKGFKKRSFIYALLTIIKVEKYEHHEMVAKAKLQPRKMVNCPTMVDYISCLEDIYNYKRSKENKIRFY